MTDLEKAALLQCLERFRDANMATIRVLNEIATGYEATVENIQYETTKAADAIERLRKLLLP